MASSTFLQAGATFAIAMGVLCTRLNSLTSALGALGLAYTLVYYQKQTKTKEPGAPGPKPWPILGSLHLMDGYQVRSLILVTRIRVFVNLILSFCRFHMRLSLNLPPFSAMCSRFD